jgi:hypothetical protein
MIRTSETQHQATAFFAPEPPRGAGRLCPELSDTDTQASAVEAMCQTGFNAARSCAWLLL